MEVNVKEEQMKSGNINMNESSNSNGFRLNNTRDKKNKNSSIFMIQHKNMNEWDE